MTEARRIGSVGPMWPPEFDERNDRVKGFYLGVVGSWMELNPLLEELLEAGERSEASRITGRFLVRDGSGIDFGEARIPLTERWAGHRLLYFGRNGEERYAPQSAEEPGIKSEEDELVGEAMKFGRIVTKEAADKRLMEQGMEFSILERPSDEDIDALVDIYAATYQAFTIPLDHDGVRGLAMDPRNLVGVVRQASTGRIVSVGIAETHLEMVRDGTRSRGFKFAELSEAATHPHYAKKGLYTAVGVHLLRRLADGGFDLAYGEARACDYGVNKACMNMGRSFSGRLLKHCRISGDREVPEEGPYENLNVWAITYDKLKELFGTNKK